MVFENGVKNIQAAAYNGARTVYVAQYVSLLAAMKRTECPLLNKAYTIESTVKH